MYARRIAAIWLVTTLGFVGCANSSGDDAATPEATTTTTIAPAAGPLAGQALIDAVANGGYVIYMRHEIRDHDVVDVDQAGTGTDCTQQSNLTEEGRSAGKELAAIIDAAGVEVSAIYVSPFCRTRETATILFGTEGTVDTGLADLVYAPQGSAEYDVRVARLEELLATAPEPGTNTFIVAHAFNILPAIGESTPLEEAEMVVVLPDGNGGFTVVGHLKQDEWSTAATTGSTS